MSAMMLRLPPRAPGHHSKALFAPLHDDLTCPYAWEVICPPGHGSYGDVVEVSAESLIELAFRDGLRDLRRVCDIKPDEQGVRDVPIRNPRGEEHPELHAFRVVEPPHAGSHDVETAALERAGCAPAQLYRVDVRGQLIELANLDSPEPYLLLLHGLFSSTELSFGSFFAMDCWAELHAAYEGRVLAFQHPSVALSPAENAVALLESLGDSRLSVDVLSYDQGGLIAELLAAPASAEEQAELAQLHADITDDAAQFLGSMARLASLSHRLGIRRHLRVASPVRGSLLGRASFDMVASTHLTAMAAVMPMHDPRIRVATELLLCLLASEQPRPGLKAMAPDSATIVWLNRGATSRGEALGVAACDTRARGSLYTLSNAIGEVLALGHHDLVYDTRSMFGGSRWSKTESLYRVAAGVHHFSHFTDRTSAESISHWLQRKPVPEARVLDTAFDVDVSTRGAFRRAREMTWACREPDPQPRCDHTIILVPGVMGTHLLVDQKRVWIDLWRIMWGKFARLDIRNNAIPEAIAHAEYARLSDYLASEGHRVRHVPYDWRKSVSESASRLKAVVKEELGAGRQVHILAHSMGGLVTLAMANNDQQTWQSIRARGGRVVLAGSPYGGAFEILRMVATGEDEVLRNLVNMDLTHDRHRLLRWIREFQGVLEMMPWHDGRSGEDAPRWYRRSWWRKLLPAEVPAPSATLLASAWDVVSQLSRIRVERDTVVYVAGMGDEGSAYDVEQQGTTLTFPETRRGDGRVIWATAIPTATDGKPVDVVYMDAVHGDLLNHESSFHALMNLVLRGSVTPGLSATPPTIPSTATRGSAETYDERWRPRPRGRRDAIGVLPEQEEFMARVSGASIAPEQAQAPRSQLRLSVHCTSLHLATHAVAVGHYAGDPIESAEAFLDRSIGHLLSREHRLGGYPGPLHSHFVTPTSTSESAPGVRGALVVGLGRFGELTAPALEDTFRSAVLAYAQQPNTDEALGLSTLLIGSHGGTGLTIEDSVRALAAGWYRANSALAAEGLPLVEHLEIVELYEDVATLAIDAARQLPHRVPFSTSTRFDVDVDHRLQFNRTAQSHRPLPDLRDSWVERLSIQMNRSARAVFELATDRSRTEYRREQLNVDLLDRFADQLASAEGQRFSAVSVRGRHIGQVFYELALPFDLRSRVSSGVPLQLVLDRRAARLPWEVLRSEDDDRPLGVRAPLVRKLTGAQSTSMRDLTLDDSCLILANLQQGLTDAEGNPLDLEGAEHEARRVARLFRDADYQVDDTFVGAGDVELTQIVPSMVQPTPHILHIAAHGRLEGNQMGIAVGKSQRIDARMFRRWHAVPGLVFLNCCHAGRLQGFAPTMASTLLDLGVRAVVVAAWEVEDDLANTFAVEFYEALLGGAPLGAAAHHARVVTWAQRPDSTTWAAYQVYGDPSFRLRKRPWRPRALGRFPSPRSVQHELERLRQQLTTRWRSNALARLRRLDTVLEGHLRRGSVLAAMGEVYREANAHADAVQTQLEAIGAEDGSAPMTSLVHLTRAAGHLVCHTLRNEPRRRPALAEAARSKEAVDLTTITPEGAAWILASWADRLLMVDPAELNPTVLTARGTARFHLARLVDPGEERTALMRDADALFETAARRSRALGHAETFYPLLVRCGLHAAAPGVFGDAHGSTLQTLLAQTLSALPAPPHRRWWEAVVELELETYRAIGHEVLPTGIVEGLTRALRLEPTPLQVSTTICFLDVLADLGEGRRGELASSVAQSLRAHPELSLLVNLSD